MTFYKYSTYRVFVKIICVFFNINFTKKKEIKKVKIRELIWNHCFIIM